MKSKETLVSIVRRIGLLPQNGWKTDSRIHPEVGALNQLRALQYKDIFCKPIQYICHLFKALLYEYLIANPLENVPSYT